MARNVEIKARVTAWDALVAEVQALAGPAAAVLHQRDTYFECGRGRLKLREFDSDAGAAGAQTAELIFYQRPDTREPALSDYVKLDVIDPTAMRQLLASAYGQRLVVSKTRWLHWHEGTRIHLDRVDSLGDFLEFEVTLDDAETKAEGEARAQALMTRLAVPASALEARGYADLLRGQGG